MTRRPLFPDDLPAAVLAGDRGEVERLLARGGASLRDLADALGLARALGWRGGVVHRLLEAAAAAAAAVQSLPSAADKKAAASRSWALLTSAWCMGLGPAGFGGPSASLQESLNRATGPEGRTVGGLLRSTRMRMLEAMQAHIGVAPSPPRRRAGAPEEASAWDRFRFTLTALFATALTIIYEYNWCVCVCARVRVRACVCACARARALV
jgi:hypothetical protein